MTRGSLRGRIALLGGALVLANLAAWAWALTAFRDYPSLLGTALLAYGFGLRHAVDADHIAAIDNVTRRLMQDGQRPVAVGLFFSLGHSTIVVAATAAIAATATSLAERDFGSLRDLGGLVGTSISALFLVAIAAMNVVVFRSVYRSFQKVRRDGSLGADDLDLLLAGGGLLARLFRPLFRVIRRSWHMYPLGVLFGLGFDTATEIGLLGIAAATAAKGLPLWSILVFPALFTAGMTLVDTADSILMVGAYGWAFAHPVRKLYYNMTITLISIAVALLVGGIEALGLVADRFALKGAFWDGIGTLNDQFGSLGFLIIGLFVLCWIVSAAIYKIRGFDALEAGSQVSTGR